jgi:hypothetical protein
MASSIKYKQDSGGIKDLLKSSEVRSMLKNKADPVLSAAQADPHDASGAYEGSLHIVDDTTDRAVVRVVADVPYALVLEANYGILARALDAAS